MSTSAPSPTPAVAAASAHDRKIVIISHCNLFYWWPVWALGFVMALLSYFDGSKMALIPGDAVAVRGLVVNVEVEGKQIETVEGIMIRKATDSKKQEHLLPSNRDANGELPKPTQPSEMVWVAQSHSYGVVFAIVLLLVIVITNVPLRGWWSVTIIGLTISLTIIFWLAGWWEPIIRSLGNLSIYHNAAGYLFISLFLFVIWLLTLFLFDRQIFMEFTSGQMRVRTEIGGGVTAYDTQGMTVEKQRE